MLSKTGAVLLVVLCCAAILAAPTQAVYLQSDWRADLTNVRTFDGSWSLDPFWGMATDSAAIDVTAGQGQATFRIPVTGDAPVGETASWGNGTLWDENRLGSISFHYWTNWTQPNLVLQLVATELAGPSSVVWSTSATGIRYGDVTITGVNPNGYWFNLIVVPEPGSLAGLASLWGAGLLGLLRSRRRAG